MSFEDDFLNFCLSCDGSLSAENEHGPYCSQACHQADLEKGTPNSMWATSPVSPLYEQPFSNTSSSSSLSRSLPPASSGFYLPPAIDFAAYRRGSSSEPNSRPDTATKSSLPASAKAPLASPITLSTVPSNSGGPQLSEQAKEELRRYESLFDRSRHRSNRTSWS